MEQVPAQRSPDHLGLRAWHLLLSPWHVRVSSDTIATTHSNYRRLGAAQLWEKLDENERTIFARSFYTIGCFIIFSTRPQSLSQRRGRATTIADGLDLTLDCIRQHYLGRGRQPARRCADSGWRLLWLLGEGPQGFATFIDFFHLQDLAYPDSVRWLDGHADRELRFGRLSASTMLNGLAALDRSTLSRRVEADERLSGPIDDARVRGFLPQNFRSDERGFRWQPNLELLRRELPAIGGFPDDVTGTFTRPVLWVAGERSPYVRREHEAGMRRLFPRTTQVTIRHEGGLPALTVSTQGQVLPAQVEPVRVGSRGRSGPCPYDVVCRRTVTTELGSYRRCAVSRQRLLLRA